MKDTVFFDLDGTLLDRVGSLQNFITWQANGMLRRSIHDIGAYCARFVELDANGSVWKDKVYTQLIEEFEITGWSVEELLASYELRFSSYCKLVANAGSAIQSLHKKGYRLGLVSNGKSPFQERNFNALGISHLFDGVVVSEAVGLRKPDPEIFMYACSELGTIPEKAIFVGDNPEVDIAGANNVGMYTVYIPGQFGAACEQANSICTDYKHLPAIVGLVA